MAGDWSARRRRASSRYCSLDNVLVDVMVQASAAERVVLEQDEAILLAEPNPFATVILTALWAIKNKSVPDERLMDLKMQLSRNLLKKKDNIVDSRNSHFRSKI